MPTLKDIIAREEEKPEGVDRLTPVQQGVITALLESRTMVDAADKAGIGRTTLYRWLRVDKNFRDEFRGVRRETMRHTTARLQEISKSAVEALLKIIVDPKTPSAARVSAIRTALDYAYRAVELEDIEGRLVDVEVAIKRHGGQDWEGNRG
jgi:superfamily I DNA and/or RNA helicase